MSSHSLAFSLLVWVQNVSYDNACKYLAEEYPREFVRWLLEVEPENIEVLKTELTLEPIRADSVTFLQTANEILHIEFQTLPTSTPAIPFRMLDYSVRLKRQYQCDVTQVVIFLQETTNEVVFTEEYRDKTTAHRFRVVRLWEQSPALFLNNRALLPLATLARTDSPQALLTQVAQRVVTIPDREERQNIAGCTEILAGLRFNKDIIRQLLREDIMRESVIYQDILQQGIQQGIQQGLQQGVLSLCLRLVNQRFSDLDTSIIERINALSVDKLEALILALFNITDVAGLIAWLDAEETRDNG